MKAIIFNGVNDYSITDQEPEPLPRDDEVVVKVSACGLCGTDIHILKGKYPVRYPLIPGHEFSGTVVKVGAGVTRLKENDRICVDPNVYCHQCRFCRSGHEHLCEQLDPIGVRRNGGFAEFCAIPQAQAYLLPDSVGFDEAAMAEPLSCVLHGIEQAGIRPGQTVAVLGGGAIGGLLCQLARLAGAGKIVVSEPVAQRRKLLLDFGVDAAIDPETQDVGQEVRKIDPQGADVVFEAAGLAQTAQHCFSLARRGGNIVFFGVVDPEHRIEISPYEIYSNEWTIRGSFINPHTVGAAVDLLAAGRVNVKPFISHRYPLEEFDQALKKFGEPDSYKIHLVP